MGIFFKPCPTVKMYYCGNDYFPHDEYIAKIVKTGHDCITVQYGEPDENKNYDTHKFNKNDGKSYYGDCKCYIDLSTIKRGGITCSH